VSLTAPLRHPDTRQPQLMTKRAWWLLGLNLLIPGSAQLLAGDRKWGRFGVSTTFVLWGAIAVGAIVALIAPPVAVTVGTNVFVLLVLQVALVFYAGFWLATTINTLALTRLVRVNSRARAPLAAFVALSLVLGVGGAGWAAWVTGIGRDTLSSIFADGFIDQPIDGRYTILLLGGDAGPDRVGLRPDSITLASVEADTGAVTMIGIPRNLYNAPFAADSPLWEEWPGGFNCGDECLVSYLYPWAEENSDLYSRSRLLGSTAGIEAMRDAVEGITGLPVQYTVLVDMQGFSDLVDALGGVTVTVDEAMELGINGGPVVGRIEAGEQRMNGQTALWYARNRYNLTDFDRMAHQRQIQEAILRQAEPAVVLSRFQAIAEAGSRVMTTDIPRSMLGVLSELAIKARQLPITDVELTPPIIDNVEPDYDLVRSLIADALAPPTAE
jgi:polyisoprenyl-teichoic acid--peptidoglycan teichoic acid transferase